jgi:hypothetical protein
MDDEVTYAFTLNGAKILRWQIFGLESEALKAVRLAE